MLTVGLVHADHGFPAAVAVAQPGWTAAMSVAWVVVAQGILRRGQRPHQDRQQVGHQAHRRPGQKRAHAVVQVGGVVHRQQERDEGRGLLPRRPAAARRWASRARCGPWRACWRWCSCRCGGLRAAADGQGQGLEIGQGAVRQEPPASTLLAAARVALFGARDVWFVVGVPVFLYASGWTFTMVGGFLALWTIGYGLPCRRWRPRIVQTQYRRPDQPRCPPRGWWSGWGWR